jgi:short-chain Z-isoprenyl diphosphate synthase
MNVMTGHDSGRGGEMAHSVAAVQPAVRGGGVPSHVAMVLDGNRRWAAGRGMGPVEGHREGARRLHEVVEWSDDAGIETLTLWVLSADNLNRPAEELAGLLPLIERVINTLAGKQRWRINHMGRIEILPDHLRESLLRAEAETSHLGGMTVNMAVGYDGRQEIVQAVVAAIGESNGEELGQEAWHDLIARNLYTGGQHDPDLIIRTSGEQRLSGFLLWQSAWSELYFCDTPWPAFAQDDFAAALASYASRQRRFGK